MGKGLSRVYVVPGRRYRATLELGGFANLVTPEFLRGALRGLGACNVDLQPAGAGKQTVTLTWRGEPSWLDAPLGVRLVDFQEV